MYSISNLKAEARRVLGDSIFSSAWICYIAGLLLMSLFLGMTSVLAIFFIGFINIGFASAMIGMVTYEDCTLDFNKLFDGFRDGALSNLVLGLLHVFYTLLWSLLFIIPGIIKSYSYSLCYVIKVKNPYMNPNDCITNSRKLMKGHKFELLCLDLSFIGWYFLGMIPLGVGVLWANAYHTTTRYVFLNEIYDNNLDKLNI